MVLKLDYFAKITFATDHERLKSSGLLLTVLWGLIRGTVPLVSSI